MAADEPLSVREALEAALAARQLVRVERSVDDGWVSGHVVDVGPVWFVMDVIGEGLRYQGFEAFRIADVLELVAPHPRGRFYKKALALRGERRPAHRGLTAWTLPQIVRWAESRYPLVTIHLDRAEPGACFIGVPVSCDDHELVLLEVTPDATWEPGPSRYPLADVTAIGFGGPYEEALALVAGLPHATERPRRRSRPIAPPPQV